MLPFTAKFTTMHKAWLDHATEALAGEGLANRFLLGNVLPGGTPVTESPTISPSATLPSLPLHDHNPAKLVRIVQL